MVGHQLFGVERCWHQLYKIAKSMSMHQTKMQHDRTALCIGFQSHNESMNVHPCSSWFCCWDMESNMGVSHETCHFQQLCKLLNHVKPSFRRQESWFQPNCLLNVWRLTFVTPRQRLSTVRSGGHVYSFVVFFSSSVNTGSLLVPFLFIPRIWCFV